MALVQRIQNICLKPKQEWDVIAGETTSTADLLKNYALPLAAVGAVASFIGQSVLGMGVFRVPVGTGLAFALAQIGLGIAGVFVLGLIVDALAPKFGAEKSKAQALKVVVYSFTPGWVAGVLGLLPALGILGLVALGYGIYLLYLGLPRLMKCPPDKAVTYTVVTVLCGVGVMFVISLITGAILATGMVATGALPGLR